MLWLAENIFPISHYGKCINQGSIPSNFKDSSENLKKDLPYVINYFSNTKNLPEALQLVLKKECDKIADIIHSGKSFNDVDKNIKVILEDILEVYASIGKKIKVQLPIFKYISTAVDYIIQNIKFKDNNSKNLLFSIENDDFTTVEIPAKFCKIIN